MTTHFRKDYGPEKAQASEKRKQEAAKVLTNPIVPAEVPIGMNHTPSNSKPLFGQPRKIDRADSTSKTISSILGSWEEHVGSPHHRQSPYHRPQSASPHIRQNGATRDTPTSRGDLKRGNDHRHHVTGSSGSKKVSQSGAQADQRSLTERPHHPGGSSSQPVVHSQHPSSVSRTSSQRSGSLSPAPRTLPQPKPAGGRELSAHVDSLVSSSQHRRSHSPSPGRHPSRPSSLAGVTAAAVPSSSSSSSSLTPSGVSSMLPSSHSNPMSSTTHMTSGVSSAAVVSPHHASRPSGAGKPALTPTHQARPVSERPSSHPKLPSTPPNGSLIAKLSTTPVKKKEGLPKLKIPEKENENIAEILKEMTQIQAPLTGIETPRKTKAKFPFPASQTAEKSPPAPGSNKAANEKPKERELHQEEKRSLLSDLNVSDDSDVEEPPADNAEPEKNEVVSMDTVDSPREEKMSSSSESSSEDSDSSSDSGSESSSDNGDEEEEEKKPKIEVDIKTPEEKPQQKNWGLKSFMVHNSPALPFNLPAVVPEKKPATNTSESSQSKVSKASEDSAKVSSSGGGGRKAKDIQRSTTLPFDPPEPEELLVEELGLRHRGNGVPTPGDADRPADKAPASVASLQSPSTTSEGSTSSKKASSKQKAPRSKSTSGAGSLEVDKKSTSGGGKKAPCSTPSKNSLGTPSSYSKKEESQSSAAKSSVIDAPVASPEKKTSVSSKTKGKKTKGRSRCFISDDSDSDSDEDISSTVTTGKKAPSTDKKSVVSKRDLIAQQLFSNDSSPKVEESGVTEEPVKVPSVKEKTGTSSKKSNHRKHGRDTSGDSGKSKASDKKNSNAKKVKTELNDVKNLSPKGKALGAVLIENPPFKPPEPLSPLPRENSAWKIQTSHPPAACPGSASDCNLRISIVLSKSHCHSSKAYSPSASLSKTQLPSPEPQSKEVQGHSSKIQSHRPAVSCSPCPVEVKPSPDALTMQQPSPCGSHASSTGSSRKHKRSKSKCDLDDKESTSVKHLKSSSSRSSHKSSSSAHSENSSALHHGSKEKRKRPHSETVEKASSQPSSHSSNGHSSSKRPFSPSGGPVHPASSPLPAPPLNPHCASPSVKKPNETQVPQQNGISAGVSIKQEPFGSSRCMLEDDDDGVSAEVHLQRAKAIKHQADAQPDPLSKLLMYTEALVVFIKSIHAMERDPDPTRHRDKDHYSGTLNFIKHINKIRSYSELKGSPEPSPHSKKLAVLTLRTQALLCLKVYKSKKPELDKYRKVLDQKYSEVFPTEKPQGRHYSPSPQPNSCALRTSSVPSPSSPAPSPAGSTASLGSQGSGDLPLKMNGNVPAAPVVVGNSISIPQRIFQIQYQDYMVTSHLVQAMDLWEQANAIARECQDFFDNLDNTCGPLSFHSPIGHLVRYICVGVQRLRQLQNS